MILIQKFEMEVASILENKIRRRNQQKSKDFFWTQWGKVSNSEECDSGGKTQYGSFGILRHGTLMS